MSPLYPLSSIQEDPREQKSSSGFSVRSGIDSKVRELAQSKISGSPGSLFASATAPKIIFIYPELPIQGPEDFFLLPKKQPRHKKRPQLHSLESGEPIGLLSCDPHSWINALMQLVLRLSSLRAFITLTAPLSFEPFRTFIDQYELDRDANLAVSSAQSSELVRCLLRMLPSSLFSPQANLFSILREISRTRSEPISFWPIEWEVEGMSLPSLVKRSVSVMDTPCDLIVAVKGKREKDCCRLTPKQIFDLDPNFYYDLHGFIECCGEGSQREYIAYLKIEGKTWYQCRNERISKLSSPHLNMPLLSATLLRYKKCYTSRDSKIGISTA